MGDFDETAAAAQLAIANGALVDQACAAVREALEATLARHPLAEIIDVKVAVTAAERVKPESITIHVTAPPVPERRRDRWGRWFR